MSQMNRLDDLSVRVQSIVSREVTKLESKEAFNKDDVMQLKIYNDIVSTLMERERFRKSPDWTDGKSTDELLSQFED